MQIAIASQNPMLSQSVSLMLSDPALDMKVVDIFASDHTSPGATRPHLVLYDADLPQNWRDKALTLAQGVPVVIVANPDAADIEISGLKDADLLVTPLNKRDLVMRVTAALSAHRRRSERRIVTGSLEVDVAKRQASVDGKMLPLTRREFDVVEFLAVRKGVTVTKEMFLDRLYGGIDEPEIKIVDVYICKIRRKIRKITGGDTLIDTVWGRGYVLHNPEDRDLGDDAGSTASRSAAG